MLLTGVEAARIVLANGNASGSTGNATLDLILPFLNLGIIVVLVIMFVAKKGIVPQWALDDQVEREKTNKEDHEKALTEARDANQKLLDDQRESHEREMVELRQLHERTMHEMRETQRLAIELKDAQVRTLQQDKEELKDTNEQLSRVFQEQFLPALIEANRLTALYIQTIERSSIDRASSIDRRVSEQR